MSDIGSLQSSTISSSTITTANTLIKDKEDAQEDSSASIFETEDNVDISAQGVELSQTVEEASSSESASTDASSKEASGAGGAGEASESSESSTSTAIEQQIQQIEEQIAALQEEINELKDKAKDDDSAAQVLAAKQAELMSLQGALQELLLEQSE